MKKMYSSDPVMQSKCEKLATRGAEAGLAPGTIADLIQRLIDNGPKLLAFIEEIIMLFKPAA